MRSRYYSPNLRPFLSADRYMGDLYHPASLNPYSYVEGNPVRYIDPMGTEKIVIAGGRAGHEIYKYQFIETAILDARNKKAYEDWKYHRMYQHIPKEEVTLLVMNYGYTEEDIQVFQKAADYNDVKMVLLNNKQEFIRYINTKKLSDFGENLRAQDRISYLSNFSHGISGAFAWGYNGNRVPTNEDGQEFYFWITDIPQLDPRAFKKDVYSISYACNTGTNFGSTNQNISSEYLNQTKQMEGKSFSQEWVNHIGGRMESVVNGTTTYKNINITVTKMIKKVSAKMSREKEGLSWYGSVNYPTSSSPFVFWKTFRSE